MDIAKLLKSLNDHDVKYVIIGAMAFAAHGWSRTTHDIDIFIEATRENVERTRKALMSFGYDMRDASIEEMLTQKILLRQYVIETDIHPFVKGASFCKIWKDKVPEKLYGVRTYFASLNDLIRMKRAAGRPKDREDLKNLLHIRKILKEKRRKK